MLKTRIKRTMSLPMIIKSFDDMILRKDGGMLVDFIHLYPRFTRDYIDHLLKRIGIINFAISGVRDLELEEKS